MGCSGPWTFGQNQEVQGAKTSHAQDGEAPDLTTRIRYDQHALEKTTLRPMSNTKPVVLKGWVDHRNLDSHRSRPKTTGVYLWPDSGSGEYPHSPATLVIGEEAIPKSEVEKIIRAANDVITRWDSPLWKRGTHTGDFINALRNSIKQFKSNTQQTEEPGS